MAVCKYCQQDITWIKEGRKNVPLDQDGGIHDCQEKKDAFKSYKELKPTGLSPEILAQYEKSINQEAFKKPKGKKKTKTKNKK